MILSAAIGRPSFMTRKTCIITEGGGLRASYGVGVIKALIEKFNITSVDMAVATSGSAGTLAYYAAKQFDSILNIWTTLLSTWKLMSFRNILFGNPILNVDYLIDVVFKQQDRLDIDALKSSRTELFIPVTNYSTGEAQYFSNHDDVDFFEVLYGKSVEIAGQQYVDGAISVPIGIVKAIQEGATDIIVVPTRPKGFRRSRSRVERMMTGILTRTCPEALKKRIADYPDMYNSTMDMIIKEVEEGTRNIVLIQPESKVNAGKLDNSRRTLARAIEQGYADACRHTELYSFGISG
jgi:predicted patatin/cPLA2 family phospholipase